MATAPVSTVDPVAVTAAAADPAPATAPAATATLQTAQDRREEETGAKKKVKVVFKSSDIRYRDIPPLPLSPVEVLPPLPPSPPPADDLLSLPVPVELPTPSLPAPAVPMPLGRTITAPPGFGPGNAATSFASSFGPNFVEPLLQALPPVGQPGPGTVINNITVSVTSNNLFAPGPTVSPHDHLFDWGRAAEEDFLRDSIQVKIITLIQFGLVCSFCEQY